MILTKDKEEEVELRLSAIAKNMAVLEESIRTAKKHVKWLEEKIVSREELLKEGLVTKQSVVAIKNELEMTKENVNDEKGK